MKEIFQLLNIFSTQGIFTTDAELKIRSWNHWLVIYSGHRASEMIDLNLLEVYPELVTRQLDKCYRDALNGDTRVLAHRLHNYLLPMPSTSSSTTFVRMPQSAQILPLTKDDRIVGTITIIDDVTERLK